MTNIFCVERETVRLLVHQQMELDVRKEIECRSFRANFLTTQSTQRQGLSF